MRLLGYFLIVLVFTLQAQHHIIPAPVSYQSTDEVFTLKDQLNISVRSGELDQLVGLFSQDLERFGISTSFDGKGNDMILEVLDQKVAQLGEEGYKLVVNSDGVYLGANSRAGIFNGMQTFKQLVSAGSSEIPGCEIVDYPRFGWRGLMLDVSRHFFTVEEVKSYIDQMAAYKFNVLHWHLTDDNGWRIEIRSLPKLTEVGAWRVERHGRFGSGREDPQPGEPTPYGGFYTQDQIREIIDHAAMRNITIVPEIDVPGHSMALLAAYPHLSTRQEPKFVNPGTKFAEWYGNGKFKMLIENTLDPSNEEVYETMNKVFTEVAQLFPGKYIHIGGDEAYHGYWEADPDCQELMKKENLKDTHELQSYFIKRMEKIISSKGKTMIGWDEILEGGLAKGAAVMSWRGMKGGIEAAGMGHDVVMSPTTYAYLDYTQGDRSIEIPIYASLSLRKSYSFEPVPEGVDPRFVLGGQGNLWTEAIPTIRHAFYMTWPRAFALAETVWSPKEQKDWDNFTARTEAHFKRFDAQGQRICKALYDPIVTVKKSVEDELTCTITHDLKDVEVYYTLDGTFPDQFSPKFTAPFVLPDGNITLNTVAYRNGSPLGRMLHISKEQLEKRAR